jgi:hypothetical protein
MCFVSAVTDVSKEPSAFIFNGEEVFEDEDTTFFETTDFTRLATQRHVRQHVNP